jgi:hypothetical protein
MYTCKEIFDMAVAIIDELEDNGTANITSKKEYYNRAPYLLNMWQQENADNLSNIIEYANTDDANLYKWVKYNIPSGTKKIKDIIFIDSDSQQISSIQYRQFGKADVYFYFSKNGTVRMMYVPFPAKVTNIGQTLEVDEGCAISGAYYLAEHFALADQNDELAKICRDKYKELKLDSMVKTPLSPTEIRDVYGIGQIK